MDQTDLALSMMLLQDCRIPYRELADKLGLSVNAVHKRIQGLIDAGIIRGFRARPSLLALMTVQVLVWGRSNARVMANVRERLSRSDKVYWIAVGSGNELYVGGFLHNIYEMEDFATLVKREGEVPSPTVGIIAMPFVSAPEPGVLRLTRLSDNRRAVQECQEIGDGGLERNRGLFQNNPQAPGQDGETPAYRAVGRVVSRCLG